MRRAVLGHGGAALYTRCATALYLALVGASVGALVGASVGCSGVPFLGSDPSAPRDRASLFDRFVGELFLELADTADPLERVRLEGAVPSLGDSGTPILTEERRLDVRRRRMRAALGRLRTDLAPSRLGGTTSRATWSRVITRDLERQLDLDREGEALGDPPLAGAPPHISPWSGAPFAAASTFAREQPGRTAAEVARWKGSLLEVLTSIAPADAGALDASVEALDPDALGPVLGALRQDLNRLQGGLGTAGVSDPFFGPLASAFRALPRASAASGARFARVELQGVADSIAILDERLAELQQAGSLASEMSSDPARSARWFARIRGAAGTDADADEINALVRAALDTSTRALGDVLTGQSATASERARELFGGLRQRARLREEATAREGAELLWSQIEERLEELVAGPLPTLLLESIESRAFERPRGRWAPFVPGDLRGAGDPLARPARYLAPRERDPFNNRLLGEAEALRYGLPGRGLIDAFRRSATRMPLLLRTARREAFEEGWALYAIAESAKLGLYVPRDGGLGWRAQEVIALAAVVIDIGLHRRGWSEAQAIETALELTPITELGARELVLRSMAEPGRIALPGIGLLRLRALRAYVELELGEAFDAPSFHRALLVGGPIPMDGLDERIQRWLARRVEAGS